MKSLQVIKEGRKFTKSLQVMHNERKIMKSTKVMTNSTKAYVAVKKGESLIWNGEELKGGLIYTADKEEYPFWGYAKFVDAFASTSGAGESTNFKAKYEAQYYEVMMYDYWIDKDDSDDIEIYGSKNIQILREIQIVLPILMITPHIITPGFKIRKKDLNRIRHKD